MTEMFDDPERQLRKHKWR